MSRLRRLAALGVLTLSMASPVQSQPSERRGVVYDSVHARPLAGALLIVGGDTVRVRSDSSGGFTLPGTLSGRRVVVLVHPSLDSLGLSTLRFTVDLDAAGSLQLATPSRGAMLQALCGRPLTDSAAVHGVVRNGVGEAVDAEVRVSWMQWGVNATNRLAPRRLTLTTPAAGGIFVACGVPLDQPLEIEASTAAGARSNRIALPASMLAAAHHQLVLLDSLQTVTLQGRLRAGARGLAGALVQAGDGREARTDSSGGFVFPNLPSGSHLIRMSAVGYAPTERLVHLFADQVVQLEVTMDRVVVLDAMRTAAERELFVSTFIRSGEERRRSGLGRFRDSTSIGRERTLLGAFVGFGGLQAVSVPGGVSLTMRTPPSIRGGGGTCTPRVIVNREGNGVDLFALDPQDIAWIEVYPRATALPAEFQVTTMGRACGVVVVVTKEFLRR